MTAETGLAGTVLGGRYRVEQRLRSDGTTTVHRGRDVVLDRPVVVTVLTPDAGTAGSARDRLQAEVRVLARLSHPGLVAADDTGEAAGHAYVVAPLAGGTLTDRLATGPLGPEEAARVGVALADVLAYLHGRGLVHGDVSPEQVLLDADRVLLVDSGVARARDTGAGTAADVDALGRLLADCLGEPPRPDAAGVPGGLARLLADMTAPDPASRPAAEDVASRLRAPDDDTTRTAVLSLPALDPDDHAAGPPGDEPTTPTTRVEGSLSPPAPPATEHPALARARALPVLARARALWEERGRETARGVRLDVAVGAVGGLLLLVLLLAQAASALDDTTARTGAGPTGSASPSTTSTPTSTPTPGADRLPADLDRLERAVRP